MWVCVADTDQALPCRLVRLQTWAVGSWPGARDACFLSEFCRETCARRDLAAGPCPPEKRFVDRAAQEPESNTVHSVPSLPTRMACEGCMGEGSPQAETKQTPRLTVLHAQCIGSKK